MTMGGRQLGPLHDGLDLLEWLSDQPQAVGVSTAAERFAWPRSRAHRVLGALVAAGYAVQEADRRYRATARVLRLACGTMSRHPLRALALPALRRTSEATGCDSVFSVLDGERTLAIAVDSPAGRPAADPFAMLGRAAHLHGAANGKVLLAWMPLLDQEALLARLELPALTAHTITDRAVLARELVLVRSRGWALNDGENHPDIRTVSVPVFDGFHRCVAALGASQVPALVDPAVVVPVLQRESAALTRALAGLPGAAHSRPAPVKA